MHSSKRFGILLVGDYVDELVQVSMALNAKDQFILYPAVIDKLPGNSNAEIILYVTKNGPDKSVESCKRISAKYTKPLILLSNTQPPLSSGINFFKYNCPLPLTYRDADNLALKIRVIFSHSVTSSMTFAKPASRFTQSELNKSADESITRVLRGPRKKIGLICIGASAGGIEATQALLKSLPGNLPPIVIVQHIPPVFSEMYAIRLDGSCQMNVCEAENKQLLKSGNAYVAPGGFQFRVRHGNDGFFAEIGESDKISGHCPSVDAMLESVSQCAGSSALGIILTGMGNDGTKGLLQLHRKGAITIGQDEQSCLVYGMPKSAFEAGAVSVQLPLSKIHELVIALTDR